MTVVRVAVPVLQGRRKFHFDKGRPWSILEHLILTDLGRSDSTAEDLAKCADVPARLIIEALVRLMRAGWVQMVAVGADIKFQPTSEGLLAATMNELPNVMKRLSRQMTFVVEQVSGGVLRSRELPFLHTHLVEERAARETIVWLDRPSVAFHEEVRSLVEALFLDDEKFVATDPYGDRLAERWSLVTVRDGEIEGLTPRASDALIAEIKKAASRASAVRAPRPDVVSSSPVIPSSVPRTHAVQFSGADLITGGDEHSKQIIGIIRKSRHRLVIHSTFISEKGVLFLWEHLRLAHGHGAKIDLMWGQNEIEAEKKETVAAVRRLAEKAKSDGLERLRIHPFSTHSHSKIVVADEGTTDRFVGLVGSCNWLSSDFMKFEASVRLRQGSVVSELVDHLTEMSRGTSGSWNSLTNELAGLAEHVRLTPPIPASGRAAVTVVTGGMHAELVRRARDNAKEKMFVGSHRFGLAGRTSILIPALAAATQRGISTKVVYGVVKEPVGGAELAAMVRDSFGQGVQIRPARLPALHAKFVAWDSDHLLVTSQNMLSADPPDGNPRQEIGVYVEAPNAARTFEDRFNVSRLSTE